MASRRCIPLFLFACALSSLQQSPAAAGAIRYVAHELVAPPGATDVVPYALSHSGVAVGFIGSATSNVFVYKGGKLEVGGTGESFAVNDAGQVPDLADGGISNGINDRGQVVGSDAHGVAFLRNADGTQVILGPLPGGGPLTGSDALGINNVGQVVGHASTGSADHPFLYNRGQIIDLGLLPGAHDASAFGINDLGQIVGGGIGGTSNAFLWDGGRLHDLGTLGGLASTAWAINNSGTIVGFSFTAATSDDPVHAFVYDSGRMYDLNDITTSLVNGMTLEAAVGIDDRGDILVRGMRDGRYHAFLLAPTTVPEPSSLTIAIALILLAITTTQRTCS